ncbi:MAG: KR domain-containing protein, partial [Ktedonobacteraceae bacterium]|nr:KR domain-containing protein [Ktedonobacteraceae bacterium]
SPKVTGLDNVLQCFEDEPLQFIALFSSVSGIIPNLAVGQSDYAMANAYMDYKANSLRYKLPVVSIQWPNWKESGLGETTSRAYRQSGFLSHTDDEGLKLLDQALAMQRGGVVLPAIVNANAWRPEQLMSRSRESVPVLMQSKTSPERMLPKVGDAFRQRTHTWLLATVSEHLHIDLAKLEIDIGLQDYGADSVMLAQLLQPISKLIGEQLDPSILYEYPTVRAFSSWLLQRYARQLEDAFAFAEIQTPSQELVKTDISEGGAQLLPIEVQEKRSEASKSETDIAVIGMSCRFPGASTLEEYWQLLAEGRSAIRTVPWQRWGHASNYYAGLLDNITHFDPAFFLIPENTAAAMDPQALLLLEEALKTCYHAGYPLEEIKGSATGVYLGARSQHHPEDALLYAAQDPIVAVGQNYLAANISRYFDFHGPSLVVDTACSSALVAMNLAIQALLNGEIETALVGGVNILQTDTALRILEHRGILSSAPYFHIFDGRASGSILGEGAGMVLLKRIDKAQKDQDSIYAVVKSVAINNDGRTAGPTAPNLQARKEVLQKAL